MAGYIIKTKNKKEEKVVKASGFGETYFLI